jgi:hypothetical protein
MTSDPASVLTPIDVRTVEFYGDQITGALVRVGGEAQVYVPIRPICDYLGLAWSGQFERIKRDEVLADAIRSVRLTRTERGEREVICLPLELLPGFLFGVNAARVKAELREKIIRYRRECYRRLWDVFKHAILPATDLAAQPTTQSGAALAYEIATAVQHLARQQLDMEQRLDGRIDHMARWAKTVENRLGTLELHLSPQEPISEEQAAELVLAVKTVAHGLEARGSTNGYQRVYGELYRRHGITSYKNLPRARFDAVMAWLHAWHAELSDDAADTNATPKEE